ncbi:MAG: hypothetical protein GX088_07660 [Clostridia bacterium]|nr:hypothetical protein [Clostridia bacterium]
MRIISGIKDIKGKDPFALTEKAITFLLILFGAVGMIGPLFLGRYNLTLLGSYLGIPMIVAPLIWHKIKKNRLKIFILNIDVLHILGLLFLLYYSASILILHSADVRNEAYYVSITVMAFCILCQILFSGGLGRKGHLIIQTEIVLLMLNILWGVNLKYHFFIGRTDIIMHSWLAQNLIDTGHIGRVFEYYEAFPLWHILCSVISQVCDLPCPPHKIMFVVNGFVYSFLIMAVYLTVVNILNNEEMALLSALFTCLNTDVIFYGMYSIPRSVVFFLEVLLILFLLHKRNPIMNAMSVFMAFAIIVYHTASIHFVWLILFLIYFLQRFYRVSKDKYFVTFNYLLLVLVMTVSYWFYYGEKVFRALVKNLLTQAPKGILTKSVFYTPLNELFNYLHYSLLFFFIIWGVLSVLTSIRSGKMNKLLFVSSLAFTFITFPGPALLLNKLARNLNLVRFGEYSFFFISMAAATGLYIMFLKLKEKHRAFIVVLFTIMAFLSVSNDFTASDNPLVQRPFYTYYLTENETTALNRLAAFTKGYLMADYASCRFLEFLDHSGKVHVLEVSSKGRRFLRSSGDDLIFIRREELSKRPLKLFTSTDDKFQFDPSLAASQDYYYNSSPLWQSIELFNHIYDSGAVLALN